jgi:quinolinate synthase
MLNQSLSFQSHPFRLPSFPFQGLAAMPDALERTAPLLDYTPEVAAAVDHLYPRMANVIPRAEWPFHAPYIHAINQLKAERNAVILAHNYQTPEIFHGVADIVGDSLALAARAVDTPADVIVMAGVHFMAETAKLLNPSKTVLIPDVSAGCSLAESVTGADVRALRAKYPGAPIVAYVNTSAEVKAEVDICCTSGNAVEVVRSLNAERIVFLPDRYLASYVQSEVPEVEIIAWEGACEVHERFTGAQIAAFRDQHAKQGARPVVIAHPECPGDVLGVADFVGSTAQMISFVDTKKPEKVLLVTECSMSDNIAAASPGTEFVRPCNFCPHMKKITLANILTALQTLEPRVEIEAELAARAVGSVERMLAVKPR